MKLWKKYETLLIGLFFVVLALLLMVQKAEADELDGYYDDPAPRMKPEVLFLGTGECPDLTMFFLQTGFNSWDVVDFDMNLNRTMPAGFDRVFTLGCKPKAVDDLQELNHLPPGVTHVVEDFKEAVSGVVLGRAHLYWQLGVIVDCDITMFTDSTSILNSIRVLTHEAGHCLGLPHGNPGSIMAAYLGNWQIAIEDRARVEMLYDNCNTIFVGDDGDAFFPRVTKDGEQDVFMGFMKGGGVWPWDAYNVEPAWCED